MEYDFIYITGLVLAISYVLLGLDDFIWDIVSLIKKSKIRQQDFDMIKVNTSKPKLIAVMIGAWHEDNVLGDVIENFIFSTIYPTSMYHIFLGVYPNDVTTIEVANRLVSKYSNVHVVVNCLPGPTSKAQNINYVLSQIKEFEKNKEWEFATFTVHDSEDVIHPYELKITNHLIENHKAVQFPVFPLMEMPRLRNFLKNITTATYADEFAENHYLTMVNRNNMGAFVPSAGTGFTLTRQVIESFEDGVVLPNDSLTEDYRLSLTLYENQIPLYYVLERVPRVNDGLEIVYDFVSTRSIFPKTFQTAVRQKTRWITGITMQSVKFREIIRTKELKFAGRYSLYKDQKAKIGNLLAFIGYPVLIYFLLSFFINLPVIYPMYSLSWYLCVLVTVMMAERQIFRAVSIYHIYGTRSLFFGCLFPPFLPFRIIWGNIINFTATAKSYRQKYLSIPGKHRKRKKTKEQVKWDKTEHDFLDQSALKRYHRRIGDILIEKQCITPRQLSDALRSIDLEPEKISLGRYLSEHGLITEAQFLECLAQLTNQVYLSTKDFHEFTTINPDSFPAELLVENKILPIMQKDNEIVIAISEYSSKDILSEIIFQEHVIFCFAVLASIQSGIELLYHNGNAAPIDSSVIEQHYMEGRLDALQALLAKEQSISKEQEELAVLKSMGLYKTSEISSEE